MMEFTISRVVLISCGVALLAIAAGAAGGAEERVTYDLDRETAHKIARMLDMFEASELDTLTIDAHDVLPGPDHMLTVHDHAVRLEHDGERHLAYTDYRG